MCYHPSISIFRKNFLPRPQIYIFNGFPFFPIIKMESLASLVKIPLFLFSHPVASRQWRKNLKSTSSWIVVTRPYKILVFRRKKQFSCFYDGIRGLLCPLSRKRYPQKIPLTRFDLFLSYI